MIIGVNETTWMIFYIFSFILLSQVIFGQILGLSTFETVTKRLIGASTKTNIPSKKSKK